MSTPPRQSFNNFSLGRKIALGAGVVLFIAHFLPWLSYDLGFGIAGTFNAFQSGLFGWLSLLLSAAVIGFAALPLLGVANPVANQRPGNIIFGAGIGALVFAILNVLANNSPDLSYQFGFFLAVLAGLGAIAGGWLMRTSGE